jgi:hypothetical protein
VKRRSNREQRDHRADRRANPSREWQRGKRCSRDIAGDGDEMGDRYHRPNLIIAYALST